MAALNANLLCFFAAPVVLLHYPKWKFIFASVLCRETSLFLVRTPTKVCWYSDTHLLSEEILLFWLCVWLCAGGQLDSGPSTPLPDKKLLLFVLDRLQKCVFQFPRLRFRVLWCSFSFQFSEVFCLHQEGHLWCVFWSSGPKRGYFFKKFADALTSTCSMHMFLPLYWY